MLPAVLAARVLIAGGTAVAAGETPGAVGGDHSSLYVAVSGVIVALISAGAVIYNSRNSKAAPPTPFLLDDEFTDNLTGLYRDAEHRAAKAEIAAEMWKARAKLAGWSEEQQ